MGVDVVATEKVLLGSEVGPFANTSPIQHHYVLGFQYRPRLHINKIYLYVLHKIPSSIARDRVRGGPS